jgi:hypothetical protein
MDTKPHTSPANPPRVIILRKYRGELKCYPVAQVFLLFDAKMDDGTCKTVRIELFRVLRGDRSTHLLDRNITRQAKYIMPPEEWKSLEDRYIRK